MIMNRESSIVESPNHYTQKSMETVDLIRAKLTEEEFIGWCRGNYLKYVERAGLKLYPDKNAQESFEIDMAKARWFLAWTKGFDPRQRRAVLNSAHGNLRPKEHFEGKPTLRANFKTTCRRRGWNFQDFDEVFAGRNKQGQALYCYFQKK